MLNYPATYSQIESEEMTYLNGGGFLETMVISIPAAILTLYNKMEIADLQKKYLEQGMTAQMAKVEAKAEYRSTSTGRLLTSMEVVLSAMNAIILVVNVASLISIVASDY